MNIQVLDCPKCGAPLHPGDGHSLVLCLYCNSNIRISGSFSAETARVETAIAPEDAAEIKRLLVDGRTDEAMALYRQKTSASAQEARDALTAFKSRLATETLGRQTLSPFGLILVVLAMFVLVSSVVGAVNGALRPAAALGLMAVSALPLALFARGLTTTVRFLPARSAQAVILNQAPIGPVRDGSQGIHVVKLLLDVQPVGEEHFRAELLVPVKAQSMHKASIGSVIEVAFLPRDRSQIIFRRSIRAAVLPTATAG